jgi:hypothetical protein
MNGIGGDKASAANAARVDPYLDWALATDFAYLGGETIEWYPVLLDLETTAADFASKISLIDGQNGIRVPSIYRRPARDIDKTALSFCMALVSRQELVTVFADPRKLHKRGIKRFELGVPLVPPFAPIPAAPLPPLATKPSRAVVVAVIDDGLAFANERFRDSTGGTRLKYFWNQDDTTGINVPPGFGWGREFKQSEINALLTACTRGGNVDEDQLYRLSGQALVARRAKHGTHVMDLACGMDPQQVTGASPYIIGVQLARGVTQDTSGGKLTPVVMAALSYIVSRADQIAAQEGTAPLPIVVNLSYGIIAGPHDGTAPLEAAIDQLVVSRATPLRVVLPAGNHYLARCHARFRMRKAQPPNVRIEPLRWRVQPDDQSLSIMEIWLPYSTPTQPVPKVEVRITTPGGAISPWIGPGGSWFWPTPTQARFYAKYVDPFLPASRPHIFLAMAPTAEVVTHPRTAPSGTWRVELKNTGRAITVDAWVQRGDTAVGYPLRGRQSRFDDPKYVRFDLAGRLEEVDVGPSPIVRAGTINAIATGQETVVVGGFQRSDYTASSYSGAGPVITPPGTPIWRDGPDVTAVGDDSVVLFGLLNAGTRSGSVVAMNGTSVAAAQITGFISRRMANGLASDRWAVQNFAKLNDPAPPLPKKRGGAGRIEIPARIPRRWSRSP